MKRRLFSILLALCMALAMLPAAAFAKSVSYNGEIIIENFGWLFLNNDEVGYYIPGKSERFRSIPPDAGPYLKVTKTGENEITITVHGNVTLQGKEAISFKDANAIKSIKNLIITGTTGKDTLSLSTTKGGTTISVLGDLTVTGITLTVTAGNGPALRANNITVSDATLIATNNSADSAAIQAMQGDGPLGNLTVSGTSAITVTNKNTNGRAIHATIINGNETPRQTDASQVTISSPAPHSHVCSDGWTSDATGHWHRCADANCTEKLNFAAHSGGTATCTEAKKCEVCGEPYGELDPSNHTDLSGWASDETHHWKTCSACNTDIEKTAHTGGTATCTAKMVCTVCGEPYGGFDTSNHTALSGWASDETHHWKTCSACNTDIEKYAHSGGTATCTEAKRCEVCGEPYGEPSPSNHTHLSDWKFDEAGHWKTCNDCGAIIEKAAHSGGTTTCSAKKKCTICGELYGELDPSNHTALSDWTSNETGHWKACADCKAADIDKAIHAYSDWIIDKEPTVAEAGAKCRECSVCHYKETATIHPVPCTHEGSTTWEPANDGVHHVKKCAACGAIIEKTAHSGGTATCTEAKRCEVCGEPYGEPSPSNHTHLSDWIFDETGHWKTCSACNTDIEKATHTGGTATCTAKKKCEVCGQSYSEPDPNNHTHLSGWASDETHHWKDCADCNATGIDNAAHTFDDWIIDKEPTATEAGLKHRTCSVCHYKETATIPSVPCTHEGSTTWEPANDGVHHVKKCADCGAIIEKTAHSGGTATCTAKKKCEICNQSYGKLDPSNHTALSDWASDETHHWKTCKDCKTDIEKAAHTGGAATCTEAKKCEVCGQSYGEPSPSNHTALSGWKFDEAGHWKTCSACSTDIEKTAHTYSEWQITQKATTAEAGAKCRECSVCHYKETATIPPVPCTHEGSTIWKPADDGVHHVKKCTNCGAEPAIEKHNFSYRDNGDNSHTMTCNICGETCIEPHNFSHKTVPVNDGKHRGQCVCGAFDAAEEHTFENGICTACGAADPTPAKPTPGGSGIIITPEAAGPVFLSGANQTVAAGSAAVFRIDYNYAAFRSVAVDGVTLTPADYTTWEGSTWVKLTPAYVKTLGIGTHTLSVYFDGATAATTFSVGGQPNPATGARDAVGIAVAAAVIALLGSAALLRKK